MKKVLLLFPILISSSFLASCGGKKQSNQDVDYYVVDFNYNLENNNSNYLSLVVMNGQTINAPKDPEVEDFVFAGWYKESECINEYLRWGLEIDSNFTLYAKWATFDSLDIETKITNFQSKIQELGKDASKVSRELVATVGYPGVISGEDGVFGVHDRYIYNRYKDIMVQDYYQISETGEQSHYGTEQFYYEGNYFYDIYIDDVESSQNETNTSPFKEDSINDFLSIDFHNFYKSCGNSIIYYSKSSSYNEDTFEYAFTGNYTKLNKNLTDYFYQEAYWVANYSNQLGTWTTQQYMYEYGLVLTNGLITSANVNMSYVLYVGEETYQYVIENDKYDFYYNGGQFQTFNGNRFSH